VCAAVFSYVLGNVLRGAPLVQLDQSVRQFLQSIRTTWADEALARVETLGSGWTLAALVATVAIWMAFERRWRTIAYWMLAAAVSQLLILILRFVIHHSSPGGESVEAYVFPSDRVASMVIVYGYVMFLLVRRASMVEAALVAAVGNATVVAVAFAGLYFDRFLFSDAIGGAAFASIWVAAVVLTSLWRYPQRPPARPFMPPIVLVVLVAAFLLQTLPAGRNPAPPASATAAPRPPVVITQLQWSDSQWKTLACYRFDMKGARREPMTIQWAASADDLRAALRDAGWSEGPQFSVRSVLSLVAPHIDVMMLPLLPKLNNGLPSPLVFARAKLTGDAGAPGTHRDVLRFWPSGYALAPRKDGKDGEPTPVWVGSLIHERLRRGSWPFNVITTYADEAGDLSAPGQPAGWRTLTLPGQTGCEGRPVKLVVQGGR
jgi:hypothetical protein